MQIWYLMIGGSQRSGNGTNECRSHGIPLNDTPHAILHVKITPSSKPPKLHLEDWSCLDMVFLVRIEWNFQHRFWIHLQTGWHQFQDSQEPTCPPRLQHDTWRTGKVLTGLFMSELNETFSIGSKYIFKVAVLICSYARIDLKLTKI